MKALLIKWYHSFVGWLEFVGIPQVYGMFKQWLRKSRTGRVVDRGLRIAVLHFLIVLVTNLEPSNIGSFGQVLYTAGLAGFDKLKNEILSYLREQKK